MTNEQIFEIEYRWRAKGQDTFDIAYWMNHFGARDPEHVRISEADIENALFRYVFKRKRRKAA
jgi:hypothetical protein